MKVIGFAGQMQMGKDESADYLSSILKHDGLPWCRGAFANGVKKVFSESFGKDRAFIEKWKVKDEAPPGMNQSVRKSLQFIGDGFRKIQSDIWIETARRSLDEPTIISDVRYVNELQMIRDVGGINVLVYRPGFLNDDQNGSEAQIRPFLEFFLQSGFEGIWTNRSSNEMDLIDVFIINDGTIGDLFNKIDMWLLPYIAEQYEGVTWDGRIK